MICHVNEPLDAQRVQGGHEVEGDPGGHEQGEDDPVHHVPGAGAVLVIPLTAVEQVRIFVDKRELASVYFHHNCTVNM